MDEVVGPLEVAGEEAQLVAMALSMLGLHPMIDLEEWRIVMALQVDFLLGMVEVIPQFC